MTSRTACSPAITQEKRSYNKDTWTTEKDEKGIPVRDYTLENPRCVYQMLKKHYERYTLDQVSSITGVSKENLLKVYKEYGATGAKRQGRHRMLCPRLDPSYHRQPEHPDHVDHPAAPRQYGDLRRRYQRPAR